MWGLANAPWTGDHVRNPFPVASGRSRLSALVGESSASLRQVSAVRLGGV